MDNRHILLVTFPGQGHINPSLQFAKRLVTSGIRVTFATSLSAINRMNQATPTPLGLTLFPISDGYDNGFKPHEIQAFISSFCNHGSRALLNHINATADEGSPFNHVVYTTFIPWVAQVAHETHIPSTLLWIQPAALLDIFYYYFNGYSHVITKCISDPFRPIEVPGLPLLTVHDLPSFVLSSDINDVALLEFKKHIDMLESETNPQVLVNTLDGLEIEALRAIEKLNMIPIGPLIPSAFLDGKDPSDTSFGGDMFQKSRDYIDWLNSKAESSVVYLSFGSISVLSKKQMEEMAYGLLGSGRAFLWVVRETDQYGVSVENEVVVLMEELRKQGMIVPWCSQVEVLSHPSLGCFVTHCGWNSTLESLACGVPMVAFPQRADQATNAKLITDVWGMGVRVRVNEEGIAEREEFERCIEMVIGDGEKAKEVRGNAKKWKELAREAVKEGGSSDLNLQAFVSEIGN